MTRANRSFVPGYVWHITQRCHDRAFLLDDAGDRATWYRWLREATSRYGLSVLDFVATSNHVHLLVHDDQGEGAIARGMQLLQGRTAQAYNRRQGRRGAFWQDRYHAVAVDTEEYLWRCLAYIDLNMVRARAVSHPRDWPHGGYNEIQSPRSRNRLLDLERLADLTGCATVGQLRATHRELVGVSLSRRDRARDPVWTESIAVGSEAFTKTFRSRLGLSRLQHPVRRDDVGFVLRETRSRYAVGDAAPALIEGPGVADELQEKIFKSRR